MLLVKKIYKLKNVEDKGTILCVYPYRDMIRKLQISFILCNVYTSLKSSSEFQVHAPMGKTILKPLGPGDGIDFRFTNKCGSRFRLDILSNHI